MEMLAWAGAQIYCHCSLDESKVQFMPTDSDSVTSNSNSIASRGTSFDPSKSEAGHVVFATTPIILFCGLSLQPNESRTFTYEERIPHHVPPSYYGSAVKYLYKLTIGTQRVKSGIQLLRIPLRILSPLNNILNSRSVESLDRVDGPVNGTITEEQSEEEKMELLIHRLECLTARKSPSSYVITNASGQVARFCLLKSSYKLGEDVIGIFNFSQAIVPCVQVRIGLGERSGEFDLRKFLSLRLIGTPDAHLFGILMLREGGSDQWNPIPWSCVSCCILFSSKLSVQNSIFVSLIGFLSLSHTVLRHTSK